MDRLGKILSGIWVGLILGVGSQALGVENPGPVCQRAGVREGENQIQMESESRVVRFQCHGGTLQGPYSVRTNSGRLLKQGEFLEGRLHGRWTRYFSNGLKQDEGFWSRGVPEGSFAQWHASGKIQRAGRFACGKPAGRWREVSKEGQEKFTEFPDLCPKSSLRLDFKKFRAGGLLGIQTQTGATTLSPWLAYGPALWFSNRLLAQLLLGGIVYKGATDSFVVALNSSLLASAQPTAWPIWFEAGAGFQYLVANGVFPHVLGGVRYQFKRPVLVLDSAAVHYGRLFMGASSADLNIIYVTTQLSF